MFRLSLLAALALTACSRPEVAKDGTQGSTGKQVVAQAKGSDTMVNLMQAYSEAYSVKNPMLVVAVTGGGSGTGIKALIDGTTDMAASSRAMKEDEKTLAGTKGVTPVETIVAFDGLSIYVNKDNPLAQIDFAQLKCIYAADGACTKWKDVGVTIDCDGKGGDEIVKLGRQNNSGTYEYFKEHVLGKESKFAATMDQSGTQQVVDVVATTRCGIGYGGMGYHHDNARSVCLAGEVGATCVEPTEANVLAGKYPFSRPLYVYTNGAPTGAIGEFLAWARGPEAKSVVAGAGFVPTPEANGTPAAPPADAAAPPVDPAAPVADGAAPPAGEAPAAPAAPASH